MKQPTLEALIYTLIAIGFCLLLGTTITQAKSTAQVEVQPIATPESYFEEPPYNPCKDDYLQFDRSEEGKQRRAKCEAENESEK